MPLDKFIVLSAQAEPLVGGSVGRSVIFIETWNEKHLWILYKVLSLHTASHTLSFYYNVSPSFDPSPPFLPRPRPYLGNNTQFGCRRELQETIRRNWNENYSFISRCIENNIESIQSKHSADSPLFREREKTEVVFIQCFCRILIQIFGEIIRNEFRSSARPRITFSRSFAIFSLSLSINTWTYRIARYNEVINVFMDEQEHSSDGNERDSRNISFISFPLVAATWEISSAILRFRCMHDWFVRCLRVSTKDRLYVSLTK